MISALFLLQIPPDPLYVNSYIVSLICDSFHYTPCSDCGQCNNFKVYQIENLGGTPMISCMPDLAVTVQNFSESHFIVIKLQRFNNILFHWLLCRYPQSNYEQFDAKMQISYT